MQETAGASLVAARAMAGTTAKVILEPLSHSCARFTFYPLYADLPTSLMTAASEPTFPSFPAFPTFESLRRECSAENQHTTAVDAAIGQISCRFKARRKSARLDFDLGATRFNPID
jgi:hypothetical protein